MNSDKLKPEDFVADLTFNAWFEKSNNEDIRYWDDWIRNHPESIEDIEIAVKLLSLLKMEQAITSQGHTIQAKEKLMSAIEANETKRGLVIPLFRRKVILWAVAASVLAAISIFTIQLWFNSEQQFKTDFAETKVVTLPDGSVVTLNSNSMISFKRNWKPGSMRELWLEGEGFFSVKHTAGNTKFIVHVHDVNVEVLGTEFDLKRRKEKTTVVLKSGSVKLTVAANGPAQSLIMKPGDLVEYHNRTEPILKKKVNPDVFTAWKEGQIVFENATAKMIAQELEENYGVVVDISDLKLQGEQFNGVFPSNNLDLLLQALSKVYNLKIEKNGKYIKIYKPAQ